MADRHEEGCFEKVSSFIFLFAKEGLSNDGVGVAVARDAELFGRNGQDRVPKPAISTKKSWQGVTAERPRAKGF